MEHVLVLCDDRWHPAEVIEKGLAARADGRFQFDVMKAVKDILTPERLKKYRLVICCKSNSVIAANDAPWFEYGVTEVCPEQFEEYVRAGGGFLAVHSGLAYMKERCPAYNALVGSTFIGHPPRCTVNLKVEKPAHPVMEGVGDFTIRDEHYALEMLCDDADVFLKSTSETGGVQPAGYTREMGDGRLCVLTPGHTLDVWENESFMRLFTNAMEWCLKER
ncbi:MAG: ThuA domain-containing protein [Eubacteriales bacterium]|nr:ThuA domain-containing protein [Eubacteriales bacterium]